MEQREHAAGRRRRRALGTAIPLIALATAVAACGTGASAAAPGSSSKPQAGGTLTYATVQQPACLDPGVAPDTATAVIDRNIFDSLVSEAANGTFHPWLATSWQISPDGLTYTFHLRTGVKFQDGTPLTAAAVKDTLDHIVNPKAGSLYAASLLKAYKSATVVNNQTVQVKLSSPDAAFLQTLSTANLGIQAPSQLALGQNTLCVKPVGTGPFRFVSWTKNQDLRLAKNPAYNWGPSTAAHTGPAYLAGLDFQFVSDDSARFGALTSGQTDVINNVPAVDVKVLDRTSGVRLLSANSPGLVYALYFNTGRAPFSDVRVRQAVLHAVNVSSLVNAVYFGTFQRAWSLLSPATPDYDPSLAGTWAYDPAQSGKLLDEAGWTGRDAQGYRTKDGKQLAVYWPTGAQLNANGRDTIAQGVQAALKQVGIDVVYTAVDTGTFEKELFGRDLDIWAGSTQQADPDVLRFAFGSAESLTQGGGNLFGLQEPALNQLLNQAESTTDQSVRSRDYAAVQRDVISQALALPVYVQANLVGASDKVHGLSFDPDSSLLFYDAWVQ
jgi:peptide/nickel transport system substrate-binding protein